MSTQLIADVRTSDLMDRLVVTPRDAGSLHALSAALRRALPHVPLHVSAEGVWIDESHCERLLGAGGVELRWQPDAQVFAENRRRARERHPAQHQVVSELREGGRPVAERYLRDVQDRLARLDDHQWVNVAAMTLPDGFGLCLLDEQGAGKTVTAVHAFDVLVARDEADFILVVAPKSMIPEWPRDFHRFTGDLYRVEVASGTRQQKRVAMGQTADVLVTNFETAVTMEDELRALLQSRRGRAVLLVDESFFIKSLDAQRTRALRRLREWCTRAYVLCGTPAPNAPLDLVQQFSIVDFGLTFASVVVPDDRHAAQDVVRAAVAERGLYVRHLKSVVLPDLPAKTFHRVLVPMQPAQEALYRDALGGLARDLRATDDQAFQRHLTSFLARRSALLQICSNPCSVTPGYSETPAKLLVLDRLLEDAIDRRHEKVVLWSFYTASIEAIMHRYSRYYAVRYDGTVGDITDRRRAIQDFQEDDHTMLFVGNPAAAGAGITLHRARFAVYESMSNQAAHYLQSLDRIHRRGQDREVEYVILLCDNTVELLEYERLTRKEQTARELLGDRAEQPFTRDIFLAEAEEALRLLETTRD